MEKFKRIRSLSGKKYKSSRKSMKDHHGIMNRNDTFVTDEIDEESGEKIF